MALPLLSMVQKRVYVPSSRRNTNIFRGFSSLLIRKKASASCCPSPSRSTIWTDWMFRPPVGEAYS